MAAKAKKESKSEAKSDKKAPKGKAAAAELEAAPAEGVVQVSQDELEEQEEAAEVAAAGSGAGGNAAALAAATSGGEISASFKNFRHHPDMENFYRFIYENDLRHEALAIIDVIMTEQLERRAAKSGKGAH